MIQYGEPWSMNQFDGRHAEIVQADRRHSTYVAGRIDLPDGKLCLERSLACVNALAGLNPAGIHTLITEVEKVVAALAETVGHYGCDAGNLLPTLKTALAAVKGPE